MSDKKQLPLIGISIGDINGIGPEIVLKVFSDDRMLNLCTPIIYASGKVISHYRKLFDINFNFNQITDVAATQVGKNNVLNCIDPNLDITPGELKNEAGKASFKSLESSVNDLLNRKIDALVTAPINKKLIQSDDFKFPGHTEYLTEKAKEKDALMLMTSDDLKVGLVTAHIPLSEVSKKITKESIKKKAQQLNKTLRKDFQIQKPKIAIMGLNPHAGDDGLLGKEEKEIIIPAIEELNQSGILAFGPFSSDGFFGNYSFKKYDGVLAMYHDQGLIPFKAIAFDKGVNYTAGLPIIRTSPDHGKGYEIAGKNNANINSFREAVYLAISIHTKRNIEEE